jgi:hypothetical protein
MNMKKYDAWHIAESYSDAHIAIESTELFTLW